MDHAHNAEILLAHPVDVSQALQYLAHHLGCENWYVACHHEHLFVFRLAHGSEDRYAVKFECTSPVEKAVYHGSKAWSLSVTALHGLTPLRPDQLVQLRSDLGALRQDVSH